MSIVISGLAIPMRGPFEEPVTSLESITRTGIRLDAQFFLLIVVRQVKDTRLCQHVAGASSSPIRRFTQTQGCVCDDFESW